MMCSLMVFALIICKIFLAETESCFNSDFTYYTLRLRESLTFVTLPETTATSNKSYSYLHWWVTIDND
jgi:hypothetical protein